MATDADVTAIGFAAALVEDEDPLSASSLEECAARNDDGLLGLPQFEVDIVGLACADVLRTLAFEDEVATELALTHFGIYFAHLQLVLLVATGKGGGKALTHTVDIMFIKLCLHLIVGEVVQLPNLLTGLDALSQLHIEKSQFTVDS